MPTNDQDSRAEPVAPGSEVVAGLPLRWASTRPSPLPIRYVLLRSKGAGAGWLEPMVSSAYSPSEAEQAKAQYDRKVLPTMVEPVRVALSRNQRYQEAVW